MKVSLLSSLNFNSAKKMSLSKVLLAPQIQSVVRLRQFSSVISLPTLEPSQDADLLSQILVNQHNPHHSLESSLQLSSGISLSTPLLHQTLLRLSHNSKIALAFFHSTLQLPTPPTDTHSFNLLIDSLAKSRQFDTATHLIIQMHQTDPNKPDQTKPNPTTFLILIRRLISAGLTRQAIRTFEDIPHFVEPDQSDRNAEFSFLLDTLCKYGYVKVAVEVFNKRKWEFGVASDVKVYTVLVYGWCKIGRIDMAERFFGEMVEKGLELGVVSYNVLLNGICRRASLHPEERFFRTVRRAEEVVREMGERGVEPDVVSFSILVHLYSRAHKPELCVEKLREMREQGVCPNVATYTSVVKCLCSCGRIEAAEAVLEEMVRDGVSPCAATFNCFFKEYRGRKDIDGTLKLFRKMKDGDLCKPTMHTYNILIGMFLKLGRMELVKEIWDDMSESLVGPDLDSYTMLIHGLCEKNKWKEACQYFVEMIEKGFLPQKITFETLYKGLIQSDMLRTWRRLKKRLDEESITFGSEFHSYHLKPYRR